ncbi:MAG TPA: hypothetical protein VE439_07155 [Anaerolineae bacterium]|jgi:hypothetical protein|nr:hypothetical protein [Anaerolineae bacterium]
MARTALLRGVLEKVGIPAKSTDTWSVVKIEKLLKELNIDSYEFLYQSKVVKLTNKDELMKVLLHIAPAEVLHEYNLILGKFGDDMKLKVGSWQFEAKA